MSPVARDPARVRPSAENATGPAPMLDRVLAARRVTAPGLVTFHCVTALLSSTMVSVWPPAENASAASGVELTGACGGTGAWSVAVLAG